ncbi:MAG: hypothetical protein K0Q79_2543 [Flavipsychrobacter sp.]|nr:hypothetical protein [Flavipsychrobacter sp.]
MEASDTLQNLCDIFSILHDGSTAAWIGDKELLVLEVDCEYLASRIDPSYKSFFIEMRHVSRLELHPWRVESLPKIVLTEISEVFQAELTFLEANVENEAVRVVCNGPSHLVDYWGGELFVNCSGVVVFDEGKRMLTVGQLNEICKSYWDDVDKKIEANVLEEWRKMGRRVD